MLQTRKMPPRSSGRPAGLPFGLRHPQRQQVAALILSVLACGVDVIRVVWLVGGLGVLAGVLITLGGAFVSLRWQWAGYLLTLAGTILTLSFGWDPIVEYSVAIFTLFGLTVRGFPPVRATVVGGVVLAAAFLIASAATHTNPLQTDAYAGVIGILAGGATGAALRVQRQYWEALEERADEAIAFGEIEAERRAAEERVRIAQDLHDIIGHNVAVISMHLGAAEVSAGRDPAALDHALSAARGAVQSVLTETHRTLNLLRASDDAEHLRPTPSIDAVPELLKTFEQIGLTIDAEVAVHTPVEAGAALIAYRVLQEALTNVHRYGAGIATAQLTSHGNELIVMVSNPIDQRKPAQASSGYGLIGMRERLATVGGALTIEHDDDAFHLIATLPATGGTSR